MFRGTDLTLFEIDADSRRTRILPADPFAAGMRCSRDGAYVYWIAFDANSSGTHFSPSRVRDALASSRQSTIARRPDRRRLAR